MGSKIQIISQESEEEKKSQILSKKVEDMGPIILDLENRALYEAWDQAFHEEISDFHDPNLSAQLPNEKDDKYISENWIKEPPNLLSFSLNRVMYDKDKKQLVKNNEEFTFEKEIYIDSFLFKNRDKSQALRQKVHEAK